MRSIIYGPNKYDNVTPPEFVLCKASGYRIGVIRCAEKSGTFKFNAYNEISFSTYMNIDNERNPYYDSVVEMQHVELPTIGRYVISDVQVRSEATDFEYKEVTALSEEVLLAQKYIELFYINMGTVESIDGVCLYDQANPDKSLMHLVLEKCPDWTVGHIDHSLITIQRSFQIDRQDVYSFLVTNVAEAFGCVFIFNSINHTIDIYPEDIVGSETNIIISYDNLALSTDISGNIDDIKTCLTITGADDLNVREVNMGYDRIYNMDYFHSLDYMSQGLYDAYTAWMKKWNDNVDTYEDLITEYQGYYEDLHEITEERRPEDPDSTDWKLYGLNPLKEKLAAYESQQAVLIKAGYGNVDSEFYESMYLPVYNQIQAINSQITVVQAEIDGITAKQNALSEQMAAIIDDLAMQKNFTSAQLMELTKFIREEELTSDNYIVTDTMTESERMDMLKDMLAYGQKELAKVAQPSLTFSLNMANIFANKAFNKVSDGFEPGNYIHVIIRDDYIVKTRLLTMSVNFLDPNDFSATFSNMFKVKGQQLYEEISEALKLAQDAATSVSFNASYWDKANKEATNIGKMLAEGLLGAGQVIHTSSADVTMDDRGMFIKATEDAQYPDDGVFIGGGQILFSDDDFKTVRTALGRVKYTKQGTTYNDFGLLADFVIAGYIAGSYIEGNTFDNGNGTFHVDPNGNLTATNATVKGKIQADSGYIGGANGWTIVTGAIYSGNKSSVDSTADGTYLGAGTGINIGNADKYLKYKNGQLTVKGTIEADSGHLGGTNGWTIASGKIYSGTKDSYGKNVNGVYLGTDGIDIGSSTRYMRYKDGNLNVSASISGSTITGSHISGGSIQGGQGMFEVNDERVYIGGFECRYAWGRDILQSSDGQCGISADPPGGGKFWIWAGYASADDYDFAVNDGGQCWARDFGLVGHDWTLRAWVQRVEQALKDLGESIGCSSGDSCDDWCDDSCDSCDGGSGCLCDGDCDGSGCLCDGDTGCGYDGGCGPGTE